MWKQGKGFMILHEIVSALVSGNKENESILLVMKYVPFLPRPSE